MSSPHLAPRAAPAGRLPNRRAALLRLSAGSVALAGLAGCDDMPASAIAGWQGQAGEPPSRDADPRVRALAWALLAPSPHNLQSWLADLSEPGCIELYVDPERLLPHTDPQGRQILIGAGAFLELLLMACDALGLAAECQYFPRGEFAASAIDERSIGLPWARVSLQARGAPQVSELLAHARSRRTNRQPYEPHPPSAEALRALQAAVSPFMPGLGLGQLTESAGVARLNRAALAACAVEFGGAETWAESAATLRVGGDAVAREPSGLPVLGLAAWWGRQLGLLKRDALRDPQGLVARTALQRSRDLFEGGTPAWIWIHSADNHRRSQLDAGRAYLRLSLQASALGLALHPNSQLLQEFPAMQALYAELHQLLGLAAPARVQMLVRIGHAAPVPPSPRRPVQALLRRPATSST